MTSSPSSQTTPDIKADELCMGPPCKHFPAGTSAIEAASILMARALNSGPLLRYISIQRHVNRFVDQEIGA